PARNALIALLLNELLPLLRDYPDQGLLPYLPEWRRAHACQGREASLQMGDTVIHGRIIDVTDDGLLLLQLDDGSQRPFASGDVRLRVSRS
ncbi:MAG: bifunctional biotin--[acetyl-CoA-carboxylase] synthetase/biotin operon repressor, partial [Methylococcaceae bacterium]